MQGEIVARSYALSLFELAERKDRIEEFADALQLVARLLDESPELRLFLETPRIQRDEKKGVLKSALGGVPVPVLNFLLLTIDKRRQRLLRTMNKEYQLLVDERLGRAHVEVTLAREPEPSLVATLTEKLSGILGRHVIPHVRVTPGILGGVVFRSGDMVYDGSLRRRLDQLKRQLVAAEVTTG